MSQKSSAVAFRASLLYGIVAGLWVLFSDRLLSDVITDQRELTRMEIYKGWLFVAFTSGMLFLIMRQLLRRESKKIEELKRVETLTRLQQETLHKIAGGKPLTETLETLLRGIEAYSPDMIGSVLLLEGAQLRHGAAPSLPEAYVRAIDGAAIGPKAGSCGTAAYRGSPVFVSDIAIDPLWTDYKHLALQHRLRSCWSTPILDEQKQVLGTFAIYHRTTGLPQDEDVRVIELVTHTAATAIAKERAERNLRGSEERFRTLVEQASDAIYVHDAEGRVLDANQSAGQNLGYSHPELLEMRVTDFEQGTRLEEMQRIWRGLPPGSSQIVRGRHRRKDGTSFPVEVNVSRHEIQGRQVFAALARNLSGRKEYEDQLAQSVSLLRATIESSASGLLVVDLAGKVTLDNNRFRELWRIPAELMAAGDDEALLKLVMDQLAEPDAFLQRIREIYRQPERAFFDTLHFKDGRVFERTSLPQRLGDKIIGRVWSFLDCTEEKKTGEALEQERELLRLMETNTADQIYFKDLQCRFIRANDAMAKTKHGFESAADLIGKTDFDLFSAEHARTAFEDEQRIIQTGVPMNGVEERETWPDGRVTWVSSSKDCLRDSRGRVIGIFGISRDITKQKVAELALRENAQRLQTIFDLAPDFIFVKDAESRYLAVNNSLAKVYCQPPAAMLGHTDADFVSAELAVRFRRSELEVLATGTLHTYEDTLRFPDGVMRTVVTNMVAFRDDRGQVSGLVGIGHDITVQKQAEKFVRLQSVALNTAANSVVITDPQGNIEWVNPAFSRTSGYALEECLGKNPRDLVRSGKHDREFFRRMWQTILAGKVWQGELTNRSKNGGFYQEEMTITPLLDEQKRVTHFVAIKQDVTERIRNQKQRAELEIQLRQSQKMEAIGQLSGGIAHDFNNILTVIQGNAALLQNHDLQPEETRDCCNQISRAAERAAGLTRQLLMFARKQELRPVNLDLNETVAQITKMLQRILGEDVTLRTEYAPALPLIHADVGMLEQIVLNLAVNARDAMANGGKLTLRTSAEKRRRKDSAEEETLVRLQIADTGCGIAPEILPRIFEPFFTTKEVGKGTGLGLATVYGIVQQHHGDISVHSEPGKGTTFTVSFPAVSDSEIIRATPPAKPALPWGTETILLVEDELPLRTFVSDLLQRCGYTVLEAESGPAALKVWGEKRETIDLLFTDVIMPEAMNGIELGHRLLAENPALKIIYTSGYTGNLEGHRSTLVEGENFIRKPYKPEALAEIIRKNLDGKTAGK